MADRKEQENLFSWDWMDDRLYWRALRNGLGAQLRKMVCKERQADLKDG